MVRYVTPEMPERLRRRLVDRLPMPPRVLRDRRRWGDWLVRRVTGNVLARQVVTGLLVETLSGVTGSLTGAGGAREAARLLDAMARQATAPGLVLQAEWALAVCGRASLARDVALLLPPALREQVAQLLAWIVEDEERAEAELQNRNQEVRQVTQRAASSVAAARQQVGQAQAEAARQQARATRAGRTAATIVAANRRRCRELEARVNDLQHLLAERDRLVADLVAAYERRLGDRPVQPPAQPLAGLRVLVVGDTPRAVAYRACARSLGARDVRFVEGMDLSESALAAAASACDLVAAVVTHVKHSALDIVRRHIRSGTRVVMVPRPGIAAFRRVLAGERNAAG